MPRIVAQKRGTPKNSKCESARRSLRVGQTRVPHPSLLKWVRAASANTFPKTNLANRVVSLLALSLAAKRQLRFRTPKLRAPHRPPPPPAIASNISIPRTSLPTTQLHRLSRLNSKPRPRAVTCARTSLTSSWFQVEPSSQGHHIEKFLHSQVTEPRVA